MQGRRRSSRLHRNEDDYYRNSPEELLKIKKKAGLMMYLWEQKIMDPSSEAYIFVSYI